MNRYEKITSMEPAELAEFLDNEENMCGTCNSRFCEYLIEGGRCKEHPEGACREATIKWLLEPLSEEESGVDPSSARVPPQDDRGVETPFVSFADTSLKREAHLSRRDILEDAIKCVCTDRNEQYGEPEDNFDCIAGYWQKFLEDHCVEYGADVCITPEDDAL